jgi:hypothetical protein
MTSFTTNIYTKTDKSEKYKEGFRLIHESFPSSNLIEDFNYTPSDLSVVYSWINSSDFTRKPGEDTNENWKLKSQIITSQLKENRNVLAVDSNVFSYQNKSNLSYLRYSLNGIYADTGYYFDLNVDPKRWKRISQEFDVYLKPWRKNKGHNILVCLPRSYGFTYTEDKRLEEWVVEVIEKISSFTDRNIVLRPHPGDRKMKVILQRLIYIIRNGKNKKPIYNTRVNGKKFKTLLELVRNHPGVSKNAILLSSGKNIVNDLSKAWCTVCYGGTVPCISVIEGVPTFLLDTNPKKSLAYDVINTDLQMIEKPPLQVDRQAWIERVCMSHFSFDDIRDGMLYQKVNEFFENRDIIESKKL